MVSDKFHNSAKKLLIFLYVQENNSIKPINKELTYGEKIKFHSELNINIQKDKDDKFEKLCYGSIQEEFTFKQILFIANENNDILDYESFKKKYEEECKKNINELLNELLDNQVLSD